MKIVRKTFLIALITACLSSSVGLLGQDSDDKGKGTDVEFVGPPITIDDLKDQALRAKKSAETALTVKQIQRSQTIEALKNAADEAKNNLKTVQRGNQADELKQSFKDARGKILEQLNRLKEIYREASEEERLALRARAQELRDEWRKTTIEQRAEIRARANEIREEFVNRERDKILDEVQSGENGVRDSGGDR